MNILLRHLVPKVQKNALQISDSVAFYACMYVTPFSEFCLSVDVIISHIHAAGIGNETIYHNDFAVVAMECMVNPGKADAVELINFDAVFTQHFKVLLF